MMARANLRTRLNQRRGDTRGQVTASIELKGPLSGEGLQSGPFTKEVQAAQEFAALLKDTPVGVVAQAAGVPKDTAKNWKKGKRLPNSSTLLWDLAPNLEIVGDFVAWKIGRGPNPFESIETNDAYNEVEAFIGSLPPHQAAAIRARIKKT